MAYTAGSYTLPGSALTTSSTVTATDHNQFRNDVATALNSLATNTAAIVGGNINNTIIGNVTAAAGNFTTLNTSGVTTLATGAILGTPASGTLTNCTFPTLNQSTTGTAATFTSTSQNSQFNSVGVGTAASGTAGEIRATNNVTAYYSDDRLKTRLGGIENALDKVATLSGFYYEANEVAQALGYEPIREVGVSAQEVQKVLPEIVVPAPIDEQYLTVRYERLVPLLIEAVKELSARVTELEAK